MMTEVRVFPLLPLRLRVCVCACTLAHTVACRTKPHDFVVADAPAAAVAGVAHDFVATHDDTLPAHAEDVVDYTLRATLDPAGHTIHGEGTITWRNKSAIPVRALWMHLYLNAFKNDQSAFLRERVGGRGSVPPEDWGWIDVRTLRLHEADGAVVDLWPGAELRPEGGEDETDVRVPLPRTVAQGEEIHLDVVFDDKLPEIVERTGYHGRFHMVGQWFPKVARLEADGRWAHFPFHHLSEFYADFGTYDVTIDVPETFTVGATGPRVESRVAAGRRIERHVQGDVHDFAWTAWDQYETTRETIDGTQVELLYPRGYERMARRDLAALRFALPYYSARYGRYPYQVLTVIHPPDEASEAGGMEYPTLITAGGPWWTPRFVSWPEIVVVHELGHQWFYGLVATDELSYPVLDEGCNQFAEVEAMGQWKGQGSLVDVAGMRVSDVAVQAVGGNMAARDEPVAQPANAFSNGTNYERLVYARTAAVLATLTGVYGDEPVLRALGRYTRRFRFKHPGPEDLIAEFRDALGPSVAAKLHAALFDKAWVDYAIDGVWTRRAERAAGVFDRGGKRETVETGESDEGGWDSSVLLRRRGSLAFPVELEAQFADGTVKRERWDADGDWKRFSWHTQAPLRAAVVDPQQRVAVDDNLGNNVGAPRSAAGWAPRSFERATYWMQLVVGTLSP